MSDEDHRLTMARILKTGIERRKQKEASSLAAPSGSTLVSPETLKILEEVKKAGGEPWERLQAKCQWEHMSLTAVIKEWGDPRTWK